MKLYLAPEDNYSHTSDPWAGNAAYQHYEQQSSVMGPPERSSSRGSAVGEIQNVQSNFDNWRDSNGTSGVHQYGSGIRMSAADCHMGDRSGLMYAAPFIPFSQSASVTALGKTWSWQALPNFSKDHSQRAFPVFAGGSLDTTFGRSGQAKEGNIKNIEFVLGFGEHAGVGLNYEPYGSIVGYTIHLGWSFPPSPLSVSITPKK